MVQRNKWVDFDLTEVVSIQENELQHGSRLQMDVSISLQLAVNQTTKVQRISFTIFI